MLIDSHCHLYYEPYINNIQNTIDLCKQHNVLKLLSIGVDINTSKKNIQLANGYKEIFCTIGIHPNEVNNCLGDEVKQLKKIFKESKKIIGIGEIGYDFVRENNKKKQEKYFHKQIELAMDFNIPIVIHSREAENETIKLLKEYQDTNLKFVVHCFTGSEKFANEILNLNGLISFGGILTFLKSEKLRNICKDIPLENILIETDSPYLSPHPFRGKTNCPSNVRYVAETIANIKDISLLDVENKTEINFNHFFNI